MNGSTTLRQTRDVTARTGTALRALARSPEFLTIGVVAVVLRAVLIPLSHGRDFVVWDHATAATLDGVNIYAHHPAYPGGPYAYLPLFLYVELPFQWAAMHSSISFTVLGKLPMLAADLLTALLIADAAVARGARRRSAVLAAAAFLLNPLVLYNSAFYGRFDSIGCAALLLTLRGLRLRAEGSACGAGWYGLAIAAKTFPVFVAAGILRAAKGFRLRLCLTVCFVLAVVLLPYLGDLSAVARDVVAYDVGKVPRAMSWQTLVTSVVGAHTASEISIALLVIFAVVTVGLSRIADLDRYVLVTLVLFLCLSKVVVEQYLTWPLPWLAVAAAAPATALLRRSSAAMLGLLTIFGCLDNETFHPFGRKSIPIALALLAACLAYLAVQAVSNRPRLDAGGKRIEQDHATASAERGHGPWGAGRGRGRARDLC